MVAAQDFVKDLQTLPSIPQVALRAQQMLGDSDVSLREVADVLALDPGISARLCRLASSPLFAGSSADYTIQQAVLRIGGDETRRLVATVAAMNAVPELPEPLSLLAFWRLGLGAAMAASRLSQDLGFDRADEAYMAGLLHCMGEAVLAVNRPKLFVKAFQASQRNGVALHEALEDALGIAPAALTAELLRDWGVSGAIVEAVEHQHDPAEAPSERLFSAILFSAVRICHALGLGLESEGDGDEAWEERIPQELRDRVERLGHADMTGYLLRQLQFMMNVEDLVRETFGC